MCCAMLCPSAGQRRVLWHNMREEPVLYINGKPYVVREADQPFCNVEYTGAGSAGCTRMQSESDGVSLLGSLGHP
jgi:hypothetical protein